MTADRWSDLVALLAGVVGLFVMLRTWPRLPRKAQVARLRHPSAPLPVGVALDTSGDTAHWRIFTSAKSVPTAVDILTWRPVGAADEWRSEPIVEPIELEPGESAVLPLVVDDPTAAHLVVLAWTVRHPGGHVQGSRTLTVGTTSSTFPAAAPTSRRWALLAGAALISGLLVVLVLVAGWRVLDGDGSAMPTDATEPLVTTEPLVGPTTDPTTPPTLAGSTTAGSAMPTEVSSSTIPAPTPTSTTLTSNATTSNATTAASRSPTDATTAATTVPATSSAPPTDPDGRSIEVRGRVEDCRFGADCVIVSFSAVGFPDEGDYVCEFADGSRVTFRYAGGGAVDACAASGDSPSVTIEIDGVRSATITREEPEGA